MFSKTIEHKKNKNKKIGIFLSPKKIELENESIKFLGLVLNQSGLRLQEHIICKIQEFPEEIKD